MKEKTFELKFRYHGGIAEGIRKFERMKPHLERIIIGALHFEQTKSSKQEAVLSLRIPNACGRHGIIGILEEFGFRKV